ncbi:hypothetical protein DAI22_12g061100 [Oryza sativa Japonica Group]|nr:hypothetical protein DAI22_12g061100 [Oryza sativa Japonica Group]
MSVTWTGRSSSGSVGWHVRPRAGNGRRTGSGGREVIRPAATGLRRDFHRFEGEGDEVAERVDEAGGPVLGVPDVGEVGVVRVQQRGDGELVLGEQRRVLVGVERRRQRRVDLRVTPQRHRRVLHLRDGVVAVAHLVQHQRPPHAGVAPQVQQPHRLPDAPRHRRARRALRRCHRVVAGDGVVVLAARRAGRRGGGGGGEEQGGGGRREQMPPRRGQDEAAGGGTGGGGWWWGRGRAGGRARRRHGRLHGTRRRRRGACVRAGHMRAKYVGARAEVSWRARGETRIRLERLHKNVRLNSEEISKMTCRFLRN